MTSDLLHKFKTAGADAFLDLLLSRELLPQQEAEALTHALVNVAKSIEAVYGVLLPRILDAVDVEEDELKEQLFDIREEFRHIDYHIHDAGLV